MWIDLFHSVFVSEIDLTFVWIDVFAAYFDHDIDLTVVGTNSIYFLEGEIDPTFVLVG